MTKSRFNLTIEDSTLMAVKIQAINLNISASEYIVDCILKDLQRFSSKEIINPFHENLSSLLEEEENEE